MARHFGNHHPPPRNTYNKPILGQTDKKTAPSPLANADNHSQTHVRQARGHSMGIHPAHDCGYARPRHHADQFKK